MSSYLRGCTPEEAMYIAISYLEATVHEWWIVYQLTEEGQRIDTWDKLKSALLKLFQPLNNEKLARDKLAKWKQVKDVSTFNEDFLRIILDIPNIINEEQMDRYT